MVIALGIALFSFSIYLLLAIRDICIRFYWKRHGCDFGINILSWKTNSKTYAPLGNIPWLAVTLYFFVCVRVVLWDIKGKITFIYVYWERKRQSDFICNRFWWSIVSQKFFWLKKKRCLRIGQLLTINKTTIMSHGSWTKPLFTAQWTYPLLLLLFVSAITFYFNFFSTLTHAVTMIKDQI